MCDEFIHQGVVRGANVSRRVFAPLAVASSLFGPAAWAGSRVAEKRVEIRTPDGVADAALFYPKGRGVWPAIVIWPDALGLRPVFAEMAKRLASSGYVVLAPNHYYRVKRAPVVTGSFDFESPDDLARLAPLRASVTPGGAAKDASAFVAFLDALPQTDKSKKIGVQGYCMGGALAFYTAGAVPMRVGAVASFHGGGLMTKRADSPHLSSATSQAEYLIEIAENDDRRNPAQKDGLKEYFESNNVKAQVDVFSGADHGWTVEDSEVYNRASAELAWNNLLMLYRRALH